MSGAVVNWQNGVAEFRIRADLRCLQATLRSSRNLASASRIAFVDQEPSKQFLCPVIETLSFEGLQNLPYSLVLAIIQIHNLVATFGNVERLNHSASLQPRQNFLLIRKQQVPEKLGRVNRLENAHNVAGLVEFAHSLLLTLLVETGLAVFLEATLEQRQQEVFQNLGWRGAG